MRKPAFLSASSVILALSLSACGKQMTSSPVAPDAPIVASSASATLSGTVGTGSGSSLASLSSGVSGSAAGITVSVVGSSETTTVDATGRFKLVITPSGNLILKFTGPGVDSTATVGTVTAGDTIEINFTINGGTAEIEDSDRASGQSREIEGRVEAVPPSTAAGTFRVAGKTVTTSGATVFRHGDTVMTFADVLLGSRVHVKAAPAAGTVLTAIEVNIQNVQTQLPVQLNGTISAFTGTSSAFSFDIDGRHVIGNSATEFNGKDSFADMKNGSRAEVKAEYRTVAGVGGLYATRIHVNK